MEALSGSRVLRVAGPLVALTRPAGVAMNDLVLLGRSALPGEALAIDGDVVTAQAYEYTGGLAPGDPVSVPGGPLRAALGPWLLGGVFDGLLRPLAAAGDRLSADGADRRPGARPEGREQREWPFVPGVSEGDLVEPGTSLGRITDLSVDLRVLVPPGCSGPVRDLAPRGRHPAGAVLALVGGTEVRMGQDWPLRRVRPARARLDARDPLHTGQRAIDLLFPVARGSTVAVPGGFGTGKTMLLQQIAKWCDADVIVYVGCGERGNEMADVLAEFAELDDPRTGGRLLDRTVVIANTSNMPMMGREASIHTGVTVAEYFRDMGLHAVVIADSTSRWAEALREFASRMGELPAEEGYPAGLASQLAAFYERAGVVSTLGGDTGSVTILGAVSPPGGDLAEPVTAHTERFVRCLWSLDRDLAYARHYPAVSWSGSFSRDADLLGAAHARAGDPEWADRRRRVTALLAEADRLADLVELVGVTALPAQERITVLGGRLVREGFLQQNALSPQDAYCSPRKSAALAEAVLAVVARCRELAGAGTPADRLEAADFTPLTRARESAGPRDTRGVAAGRDDVLRELR